MGKQVRIGDVVIRIEGVDVVGRPLNQVREMLKGPPGTYVLVTFERQGEGQVTSTLVRVAGPGNADPMYPSRMSQAPKSEESRAPIHRLVTYDWENQTQKSMVCDSECPSICS